MFRDIDVVLDRERHAVERKLSACGAPRLERMGPGRDGFLREQMDPDWIVVAGCDCGMDITHHRARRQRAFSVGHAEPGKVKAICDRHGTRKHFPGLKDPSAKYMPTAVAS